MSLQILSFILLILYAINVNIYFYFMTAFKLNKEITFFKELNSKGVPTIRFMTFYENFIQKASLLFIFLGLAGIIRHVWF